MRKIEQNMLSALHAGRNWSEGNTMVANGVVYLHGSRIAYRKEWANGETTLEADAETLKAWPTNTTRSRLRALGFRVQGSVITGRA